MRPVRVVLLAFLLCGCAREANEPKRSVAQASPNRTEIWAAIQLEAARYRLETAFIYALVAAESNFDPRARKGDARGLLQITPAAWRMVSAAPYEPTVWDWRANLKVGIDYLAYTRSYLHQKGTFSYPLLLAAFHYGIEQVEECRFDISRLPPPDNPVYRQLWAGNLAPVPAPR